MTVIVQAFVMEHEHPGIPIAALSGGWCMHDGDVLSCMNVYRRGRIHAAVHPGTGTAHCNDVVHN